MTDKQKPKELSMIHKQPSVSLNKKSDTQPKELDKEITEILMCMYNSGDTTNCLADIKKLILEAEIKKGLVDFQICREELTQQRTELLEEIKKDIDKFTEENMTLVFNPKEIPNKAEEAYVQGVQTGFVQGIKNIQKLLNLLNKKDETK